MLVAALLTVAPLDAQVSDSGSVTLRFVDVDLRAVVTAMGRYLPKPIVVSNLPSVKVSVETPGAVPRATVTAVLRGLAAAHQLEWIEDSLTIRLQPRPVEPPSPALPTPPDVGAPIELFVIRLRHARASDVAAVLSQLFQTGGEFSGRGGLSGGSLTEELRRGVVPPQAPSALPGVPSAPPGPGARPSLLAGAVVIVPDELTNALLVRARRTDYEVLAAAVEQIDVRPLQVLIEVLIVEVRRDRGLAVGVDATMPPQPLDGGTIEGTLTGGGLGDLVVKVMSLGKFDINAALGVSSSRGMARIVSRPVVLASNNQEARILVGSQRPFVQVSRSLPTDSPQRDQVVQYKDVGNKLTVRPTINADGYIALLLRQEISNVTAETQFDAPVISTREASTQLLVRDSQTIVIGGLRDRQRERVSRGIPVLSWLPIVGGLFGRYDERSIETELFLFLTPRIIRTDDEATAVTEPRLPPEERQ